MYARARSYYSFLEKHNTYSYLNYYIIVMFRCNAQDAYMGLVYFHFFFCKIGIVTLSVVFDKYYPIID